MADEYNRLAMYASPVAPVENRLAQAVLPQGHPSNMLMWLRDQIPQVQADDTSTMSGITSRLGRTATAIPRAGLETMSNWLRGTHDPNAVRIGEDTIAPLGLFGMAGMAGRGVSAAAMADNARSSVPGTVVQAMGDRSLTELTDTPPRFRPDRAVAATENNPYVVRQGAREGSNYFALDEAGNPIGYASTTTHPIGVKVEGVEVAKGHRGQGVANNIYDTIEQSTGLPVKPSGTLSDDGLRLWQGRDPSAVQWHQQLASEPGWNYSPRELKRLADDRGHAGAREAFEGLPPEARTPERLSTMFADNAKSSVPGVVVQGLDMSQEARLGRAREQGFDTSRTWHHGTDAEFDAFQARPAPPYSGGSSVPAVWLTSSPRVAGAFAEAGGQPGRVIDTHIAAPNLEVVERGFRSPDWETMDPILQRAREAGKDGVMFKRSNDHPDSMVVDPRVWNASDVVAMFNPSNIRSTQAAFDPAKRDSANLLATNPSASSPGLAASASQQDDNPVLDILRRYDLY
jgi:hypothetical protein